MKRLYMQIAKKALRGLIITMLAVALLLIAVVTVLAWSPDFASSPYTGNFWKYETSNNWVGVADWIKWNSYGVHAMSFDDYPRLDMTADCVSGSSGDKLDYIVAYTNIPNWGVSVWSDCGYPWIREEVEVYINKNYAVVAERAYYYQVHYAKKQHFVSGEVNLTYQRDNQPTHDWLDKETYFLN